MANGHLNIVYDKFNIAAEAIHEKFLAIAQDKACARCQSAGFGEAILTAWLQTNWAEFSRELMVASLLGMRSTNDSIITAEGDIKAQNEAKGTVTKAAKETFEKQGLQFPVWHSTGFVIEISQILKLPNYTKIESALGPTPVPERITQFRNYLVHPTPRNRSRYEELLAKLGMLGKEPEELLHQTVRPGLVIFTSWIRELQLVSHASTN